MNKAATYCAIKIIFNPNSTGDAPALAKKTAKDLKKKVDKDVVELVPTKYAGHAEKLAYDFSKKYKKPLIISVSGDGGYHEVVNGVLKAKEDKVAKNPVVTVVGAGNANDHYRTVVQKPVHIALDHEPKVIDLLRITIRSGNKETVRYAHSYAGIGITPRVAEELNRHKLNMFKEFNIIRRALFHDRPLEVEIDGKRVKMESLLFANIVEMAKVLTLNDKNSLHDGKFEVVEIRYENRLKLLRTLIRAATLGLKQQPRYKTFSFTMCEDSPIQADGEITALKNGTRVTISVAKDALTTLI